MALTLPACIAGGGGKGGGGGCESDSDCKGDRVCESGECTSPGGGTGSGSGGSDGSGGDGGGGSGTTGTVAKFCNSLSKGGEDVVLTLDLDGVRMSALSGTCTPEVPMPCTPIAAGVDVPIALLDGGETVASGIFSEIDANAEILFIAEIDDVDMTPTISGGPFLEEFVCSETNPFE